MLFKTNKTEKKYLCDSNLPENYFVSLSTNKREGKSGFIGKKYPEMTFYERFG